MDLSALFDLSYGVYVVSSMDGDRPTGCIANSAMQITAEPPTLAVSINHDNFTHGCIEKTGRFSLSILPETIAPLTIGRFGFRSGRDNDKFDGVDYQMVDGLPVLSESTSYCLFEVTDKMETETHTIFLARLLDAQKAAGGKPMTYSYYHQVIKGKAPKTAPTYQPPAK
ncbi:MAG: flavin reductase family protein [Eubacteriales bacterium]|nr:flavin reductase family protein [Eubacteriales bacterium]